MRRREPGRSKAVLRITAIKEHVSGGSGNVLDLVLNTPANNGKRIDLGADVDQTAAAALRNSCQRSVDFQVTVGLLVVQLNIAGAGVDAQRLAVVVTRNQRVSRLARNLVLGES